MVQEMTSNQGKYLWSQDLLEWLAEIKDITDEAKKVEALNSLVSELPESQSKVLQQAPEVAQAIADEVAAKLTPEGDSGVKQLLQQNRPASRISSRSRIDLQEQRSSYS